jgi:hypothetical protein
MAQELGQMPKPDASQYTGSRKLFLVPAVFTPPEPPTGLVAIHDRYWAGVQQNITHLANRLGSIRRIYIEMLSTSGDEALKTVEAMNGKMADVVRAANQAGGEVTAIEDGELSREAFDWQRCLMVGLSSQKVARLAHESYLEATRKRYEHIARRIDETLQPDEVGLLLIGEDHGVQFPADIQVFYIAPPALDELHRWLRDRRATEEGE